MNKKDLLTCGVKSSIRDVMMKLEVSRKKIVCVINKKKLIGVVNDGDIRRCIIKGFSSSLPVTFIMNKKPVFTKSLLDKNEFIKLMYKFKVEAIPIFDKGKIMDIITADDLLGGKMQNNIVIFAGGLGKRLLPLTKKIPKPLVSVNGKKIIDYVMNNFIKYEFNNFNFITGHKHNLIKKHIENKYNDKKISFFRENKPLGTCGGLSLINKKKISDNFLIINSDVVSGINFKSLLSYHIENNSDLTIVSLKKSIPLNYGKINFKKKNQEIITLDEKPLIEVNINAGIYAMNKKCLNLIKKNKELDMPDFFKILKAKNFNIKIYPCYEYWYDIGSHKNLIEFKTFSKKLPS